MPLRSRHVPPRGIAAPIPLDVIPWRLQWPVGRGIADKEEERLGAGSQIPDSGHRFIADGVGVVEGLVRVEREKLAVAHQCVGEEVAARSSQRAIPALETSLVRKRMVDVSRPPFLGADGIPPSDMPLAGEGRAITRLAQGLGNSHAPLVQVPLVGGVPEVHHHMADAGLVRVESGEQ